MHGNNTQMMSISSTTRTRSPTLQHPVASDAHIRSLLSLLGHSHAADADTTIAKISSSAVTAGASDWLGAVEDSSITALGTDGWRWWWCYVLDVLHWVALWSDVWALIELVGAVGAIGASLLLICLLD
jgi:hypothetical protein